MNQNSLAKELSDSYLRSVRPDDNREIILFGYGRGILENLKNSMNQYLIEKRKDVKIFVEEALTPEESLQKKDKYVIDVGYFLKNQSN